MSTRTSIFLHEDPNTGVTIHVYDECAGIDTPCGLRLEIEHAHGVTNLAWPLSAQSTALLEGSKGFSDTPAQPHDPKG